MAAGIEPNEKRIREHLDNALMLVTALNPHIGYEKADQISLKAYTKTSRCGTPSAGRAACPGWRRQLPTRRSTQE
jgi:fumarate hydratase class II